MNILFYDLEVTPMLGWTYKRWDASVVHVERESHLLCFSYKWLGDDNTNVISLLDFPKTYKKDPHDDSKLVESLWAIMEQADILVAHNANGFDNKVANERFLFHNLPPLPPHRTIDTLAVARRHFFNSSNSLDNLCRKFGIGEKGSIRHSDVWHGCVNGDLESWSSLIQYCADDTELLEKLYLRLRPYITNHPNVNDGMTCPKCGSDDIQRRGYATKAAGKYRRFQCQNCGGWSQMRLKDRDFEAMKVVSA